MSFPTNIFRSSRRRPRATTLVEAMILMVVLSVIVMGTGVALQSLERVPTANNKVLITSNLIADKIDQLKALGFTALAATASGSDSVTVDNTAYTRTWTITPNPGGAYDNNFVQVTVAIGNTSFTTAVCKP